MTTHILDIHHQTGNSNLATVYIGQFGESNANLVEFVEARDPSLSIDDKWVIIISTQFGCPVKCLMCDAGHDFFGNLTEAQLWAQINHILSKYSANTISKTKKLKIQFARMGEPSLNPFVLETIKKLPYRIDTQNLIPCIATTAPKSSSTWFESLLSIRSTLYAGKPFQLQFSINTTDHTLRDTLIPISKLSFSEINTYAQAFSHYGPRKVSLNFALCEGYPIDEKVLSKYFDPDACCIKITPVNPTEHANKNNLISAFEASCNENINSIAKRLESCGFDVIISIGDIRENSIGSNCGMLVKQHKVTRTTDKN